MAQVVEAHQHTEGITGSASWRITKPLRVMKAAVTKVMSR